jgi:hypothetical protein
MPQISKEQIEQLLKTGRLFKGETDMLQGLLDQPEQTPYAIEAGFSNGDSTYSVRIQKMPLPSYTHAHKDYAPKFLYTHPAPFTPITAADVPTEVVEVRACYHGYTTTDKEIIAAAVNAWGAKK